MTFGCAVSCAGYSSFVPAVSGRGDDNVMTPLANRDGAHNAATDPPLDILDQER
jgi:hypothetical protein